MSAEEKTAHPLITEPVEKWLTALESKKYKQCRGYLQNSNGYCCLGVAALVVGSLSASDNTEEGIGVMRANGIAISSTGVDRCVEMNDKCDKSFPEIAAVIRANPEHFFVAKPVEAKP